MVGFAKSLSNRLEIRAGRGSGGIDRYYRSPLYRRGSPLTTRFDFPMFTAQRRTGCQKKAKVRHEKILNDFSRLNHVGSCPNICRASCFQCFSDYVDTDIALLGLCRIIYWPHKTLPGCITKTCIDKNQPHDLACLCHIFVVRPPL